MLVTTGLVIAHEDVGICRSQRRRVRRQVAETLGRKKRVSHDNFPEAENMEIEHVFALSGTLHWAESRVGEEIGRRTLLKLGKGKYLKLRTDS